MATAPIGNNQILRELDKFYDDWMIINKMLSELREKYPDKFVAVKDGKVIDADSNLESLLKRLKDRNIDPSKTPVEFISKKPEFLIA